MKRNIFALALSVVALACSFGFSACTTGDDASSDGNDEQINEEWGEVYTVTTAYAKAVALGYTGTLEEFVESISGKDGVGVKTAEINSEGYLIITLSNGEDINCGKVNCRHGYSEWTVGLEPTCTSIGYDVRTCDKCGDADYRFVAPTVHNYTVKSFDNAKHTLYCSDCGVTFELKHEFADGACKGCGLETQTVDFNISSDGTHYLVIAGDTVEGFKNLVIPATYEGLPVTGIDNEAFYGRKLNAFCFYNFDSVTLPVSITSIGSKAFNSGCKTIYYSGTREQWNSVDKATDWDSGMSDYSVVCIDD